ncbi:MAG TPA: hypothetical protein VKU00_08875 [Chthonomonadaceae bacterium]|nr:hypothetical protein [Chthonomonadaceae bacterium]
MQDVANAGNQSAMTSQQMANAARQANSIAQTGGKAVQQTVASMERIKQQLQREIMIFR